MIGSADVYREALELSSDAIVISDPIGSVQFANRQMARLFGYAVEEVLGQSIEKLVPERLQAQHLEHRARLATARDVRATALDLAIVCRRKDGSEFPVDLSLGRIYDGRSVLILETIRDRSGPYRDRTGLATFDHAIRQPLQSLSTLNALLSRRRELDEFTVTQAISLQAREIAAAARLVESELHLHPPEPQTNALKGRSTRFGLAVDAAPRRRHSPFLDQPSAEKVLVVFADAGVGRAVRTFLNVSGYEALSCASVQEAQAIARANPDLALVLIEAGGSTDSHTDEIVDCLHETLARRLWGIVLSDRERPSATTREAQSSLRWLAMPIGADELLEVLQGLRQGRKRYAGRLT